MSPSFNGYNGPSQNSHAPASQNFEGLSGSLIFPDPSTAVQPNYGQAWSGPQGWQNHGQNNFNFGLTFPTPAIDSGTYFPNHQEDFVPFDKSASFYDNDNMAANISLGSRAPPLTPMGEVEGSNASRELMQSRLQDLMKHPALKRPSSESQGQPQVQHTAANSPAVKSDANARAAELRARLLANRGSTPVTPSGVPSKPTDAPKTKTNDAAAAVKLTDSGQTTGSRVRITTDKVAKAPPRLKSGDITLADPLTPSVEKANASTDIDGLFAEARAAVAAQSTNMEGRTGKVGIAGTKVAEKMNESPTTTNVVEKPLEAPKPEGHRRSLNNSTPSSEMSELGEIRSDSGKPSRTSHPSEVPQLQETKEKREQPNETKDKDQNPAEKLDRQTHDDTYVKQTIKTFDKGSETRDPASPKIPRNISSSKTDLATPQRLVQNLKIDNRQDRNGRPSTSQESRKENEPDRRRDSTIQEAGHRSRSVQGYQQWSPYDRDRAMHQRDGEARRLQPPRYDVNESARAANEYKRQLEARRQQAASHKAEIAKDHNRERAEPVKDYNRERAEPVKDYNRERAEPVKDYNRERAEPIKEYNRERAEPAKDYHTKETAQQQTEKNMTSDISSNSRANDQYIKPVNEIRTSGRENRASDVSRELSDQDTHDHVEDVRDWLEMTGYFDVPYRQKGLVRFRKIRALDIQRAELEREAQLDLEGRSHFARSHSAFPRDSVERGASGSAISPQAIRSFVSSMPPPPLPAKDATDDMGIKIKDSANRESYPNRRASDDGMRSASKHSERVKAPPTQTLKRYHEPDEDDPEFAGARPAEKVARTNLKSRTEESNIVPSPARGREEAWGQENRNNRNAETRMNERRGRSRSPEPWNRSDSPIRGRASGYDQYVPSQQSRASPSRKHFYSPDRQGVSRHHVPNEKPKEVNRSWCRNCNQPDHSAKDCPEPNNLRENGTKEMRPNDSSQTVSYTSKKYDIKKEDERDYQSLEDEQQNQRSSTGYYHYYHPNSYRGRGRGRGGYISANSRGGYRHSRANGGNQDEQNGTGIASLNLEEGG
jgi:hypothetical protein